MKVTVSFLILFFFSSLAQASDFELTSPVFNHQAAIPAKYTCDGENISPPLRWSGTPKGTQSLALIVEDRDAPAGIWVHWVLYNLPPVISSLPEGLPSLPILMNGEKNGTSDFKKLGYGGPCPPSGNHRYFFKLYALDFAPDLKPGLAKKEFLLKIKGHILGKTERVGTYQRSA